MDGPRHLRLQETSEGNGVSEWYYFLASLGTEFYKLYLFQLISQYDKFIKVDGDCHVA